MNSYERLLSAARLGKPDMVPVAPYMGNHGARVAGVPIGEYCRSGLRMYEAQIRAWELYGQDAVVAQSDNYYIAEGFGVEVDHHPDSTPTFKRPAVEDLEDIDRLRVPNPYSAGRMPVYLDAIQRLAEATQGQAAVRAPGTGPFSLAAHLLGSERFLMELAMADRDPDGEASGILHHLMDLTTQALTLFALACLEAGAQIVQAGDSMASLDVISPGMYRRWALPYEKRFFSTINPVAERKGAATLLHVCGNMTPVLPDMADSGAHILELDWKVNLQAARQAVGHRVCLMGNLDPVDVLWRGSVAEVESAARQAIRDAGADGAFILGSGCEVAMATPPENIATMIRTAREWSRQPS